MAGWAGNSLYQIGWFCLLRGYAYGDLELDPGRVLFIRSGSVLSMRFAVGAAAATSSKCTWRAESEFRMDWLKFGSLGAYSRYAIAATFSGFGVCHFTRFQPCA
jgi:hypothetical protein